MIGFVLVAKITPAHVEATIFSFSSGIINMSIGFGILVGNLWNWAFFHIDSNNLENLYKMIILQMALGFVCLLYIPLIPTWKSIDKVQKNLRRLNTDSDVNLRKISEEQHD